jgi:hypothetical protein
MLTPEMVQAERELDARINSAFDTIREATEMLRELEEKEDEPIPDEVVDQLRVYVTKHARTPEWQLVIDRINEGEMTWRQVVEREGAQRDDAEVVAAFASIERVPLPTMEQLVEMGLAPRQDEAPPTSAPPRERPGRDQGDDDSFENPAVRTEF